MYTPQRFLYDNEVESAILTADQQSGYLSGVVTQFLNTGETATVSLSGQYTGQDELIYTIDVDGTYIAGVPVYRWRKSSTPLGSWEAENVTCPTSYVEIEDAIYIKFSALPYYGGRWQVKAVPAYSVKNALNRDRRKTYRTPVGDTTITINAAFAAPVAMTACAVLDTNFTAAATVTIKGNSANSGWGSPAFSQVFTAGASIAYFAATQTYRYWQLEVSDAATTETYLEIGEWFLGTYMQLSQPMRWGSKTKLSYAVQGVGALQSTLSEQNSVNLSMPLSSPADIVLVKAMLAAIHEPGTMRKRPIFFHEFSDEQTHLYLGMISSELELTYDYLNLSSYELTFEEIARPYAY